MSSTCAGCEAAGTCNAHWTEVLSRVRREREAKDQQRKRNAL